MRAAIVGLEKKKLQEKILKEYPAIEIVEKNPDLVLCYGGDGTLLYGERAFPGVPKALLRNSPICHLCYTVSNDTVLYMLQEGHYDVVYHPKLEARVNDNSLIALNDVIIGHSRVNSTLRMKLTINGKSFGDELFGDGCIISTPIGSTGYYKSITSSYFETGIGIAFNNVIQDVNHMVMSNDSVIELTITRGPGALAVDNDEKQIHLSTGDIVRITVAPQPAALVELQLHETA